MPCQFIINNRMCKIPTQNKYCHIHRVNASLTKKIAAQKNELTILNKRLSEALRKLHIIDECDRIKLELMPIANHCSFRSAITNYNNKEIVERIFDAPFHKCLSVYNELLNQRNELTHRYTRKDWETNVLIPTNRIKPNYRRSLTDLLISMRYD